MPVSDHDYMRILSRMKEWMEHFPNPDEPIIGIAGEDESVARTPRQMFLEVKNRTHSGQRFIENWVSLVGVDHILKSRLF